MKTLIVHIPYQHRGGEDVHVETLLGAYRDLGWETEIFPEARSPSPTRLGSALESLVPRRASWPGPNPTLRALADAVDRQRPNFLHLHNAFPDLGPAFFEWVIERRIPLLMTVHNHRFFCTNGIALRDGRICKDCFGSKTPWRPLAYNCNGEVAKSAYHALALGRMHQGDLYRRAVRRFIAPSPYIAGELIRWGVPENRISQILNPIAIPTSSESPRRIDPSATSPEFDVLYAGRLSYEKGVDVLLQAARLRPQLRFAIAGDGPESAALRRQESSFPNVRFLGRVPHDDIAKLIGSSRVCALPSRCEEILPTLALEAFTLGRRCVVPGSDSTRWLARDPFPGLDFTMGDPTHLAETIDRALDAGSFDPAPIREFTSLARFGQQLKTATLALSDAPSRPFSP